MPNLHNYYNTLCAMKGSLNSHDMCLIRGMHAFVFMVVGVNTKGIKQMQLGHRKAIFRG